MLLATALNEHFLFNQLQESDLLACVDKMVKRQFSVGEDIITQVSLAHRYHKLNSYMSHHVMQRIRFCAFGCCLDA